MQQEKIRAILTEQRQQTKQQDEAGFTLQIYKGYTDIQTRKCSLNYRFL